MGGCQGKAEFHLQRFSHEKPECFCCSFENRRDKNFDIDGSSEFSKSPALLFITRAAETFIERCQLFDFQLSNIHSILSLVLGYREGLGVDVDDVKLKVRLGVEPYDRYTVDE